MRDFSFLRKMPTSLHPRLKNSSESNSTGPARKVAQRHETVEAVNRNFQEFSIAVRIGGSSKMSSMWKWKQSWNFILFQNREDSEHASSCQDFPVHIPYQASKVSRNKSTMQTGRARLLTTRRSLVEIRFAHREASNTPNRLRHFELSLSFQKRCLRALKFWQRSDESLSTSCCKRRA